MFKFLKNKIKDVVDKFKSSAEEEIEETQEAQDEIEQLETQPQEAPQEQPEPESQPEPEPIPKAQPKPEPEPVPKPISQPAPTVQEEPSVTVEVHEEPVAEEVKEEVKEEAPKEVKADVLEDDDKDIIDLTPQPEELQESTPASQGPEPEPKLQVPAASEQVPISKPEQPEPVVDEPAPIPLEPKAKKKALEEVKEQIEEEAPPTAQMPEQDTFVDMEAQTPREVDVELVEEDIEKEYDDSKKGFLGRIFRKKKETLQEETLEEEREEFKEDQKDKQVIDAEESALDEVKEEIKKEDGLISLEPEPAPLPKAAPQPIEGVAITYFVHGTTTDNEQHIATGWNPGELSPLGVQQSKDLGPLVADKHFDVVISSDSKRAVDSAVLSFKDKYKLLEDKRIREANYGDLNGEPGDFKKDMSAYFDNPFPNGESYRDVQRRVAEFLNYLYDNYYGKRVALVSHHAPQLAIEVLLQGKTWAQAVVDDWRPKKQWQPGWDYMMSSKVPVPPLHQEEFEPETVEELQESEDEEIASQSPESQKPGKEAVHKDLLAQDVADATQKKKGFLSKVKERMVRFKLTEEKFEEVFWEFELALMENNVAVEVIEKIKKDMHDQLTQENVSRRSVEQVILDTLKASVSDVLNVETFDFMQRVTSKKPFVIAMIGVNGSGKTTALAKLIKLFQKNNLSVVVAAADTFRAAAIQQLEEHTTKLGVKLIKHDYNADPAAVAFDAVKHATAQGLDIVLIDTAGRLQSNSNLMDELKKVIRVNKPDLNIFVGESITGNDCVEQAVAFNEAVGIDGMILSKADIDEKGGAALSVSYVTKKPILFIGTGQTYDDLKPFDKEEILANLGL